MKDLVIDKENIINELIDALNIGEQTERSVKKCLKIVTGNNYEDFVIPRANLYPSNFASMIKGLKEIMGDKPCLDRRRKAERIYDYFTNSTPFITNN